MMTFSDRTYHLLSMAVIAVFLATAFFTLSDYGMGWDEQVRWRSGDLKLEYYKALFSDNLEESKDLMHGDRYPGLFDLPLALFHSIFGGNRMVQGHILSILFGALGLVAIQQLANTVFGAKIAFFSTILLAVLPLFYGHAMMNPKDIPFMATYTLGMAFVLRIAKKQGEDCPIKWADYVICGLAIGLSTSARVPGFILVPLATLSWIGMLLFKQTSPVTSLRDCGKLVPIVIGISLTSVTAFCVLLVFFPRAQIQLFSSLSSVTSELHTSANSLPLIFNGRIMDARDGPVLYAPIFLLLSTPIWMVLLFITGVLDKLSRIIGKFPSRHPDAILQILFVAMAAFPWIYVIIRHPALHDGARHMLFGVSPLVVFMACGIAFILEVGIRRSKWIGYAMALTFIGCTGFQIYSLYRMHPYQYVSFNALAGNRHTIPSRFETEYWCTSSKHLLEMLPAVVTPDPERNLETNPIRIRISGALDSATPFVPDGFRIVNSFERAEYYLANTYCRSDLLADGEEIYRIERGGIPIAVIKKLRP